MIFRTGQKVACINDDWTHPLRYLVPNLPRKNSIYHVRGYNPNSVGFIWLVEVINPIVFVFYYIEPSFSADCFRPMIERKTDISCFTRLLTPAPKTPVDA